MKCCKPVACFLLFLAGLSASPLPVLAQRSQSNTLSELRRKVDHAQEDLAVIDGYLNDLIAKLNSDLSDPRAPSRFRNQILQDYKHQENSQSFKNIFAQRCSSKFGEQFRNASGPLSRTLVRTLIALSNTGSVEGLQQALNSPEAATRAQAIKGISDIGRMIESNDGDISGLIKWLGDIASSEQSPMVLGRIYRAFVFSIKQDEQVNTILKILESRLEHLASDTIQGEEAETEAWDHLFAKSRLLDDPQKQRLVRILAKFLVHHTHRFTYKDLPVKNRQNLLRLIFLNERLLETVTNAPTNVRGLAKAVGIDTPYGIEQILQALQSWVGLGGEQGFLNRTPWQVPVAAGVNNRDFSTKPPIPSEPLSSKATEQERRP